MPAKKNKNAAKQQKATAPASSEVAEFSAKMLLSEVESPETECVRRCKAAQELRDLATSDAAAFAVLKGSDVVAACWRLVGDATTGAEDVAALVAKRDGNRDAILPSVLDALAELALVKVPHLLGQQMSSLVTVLAVARKCGAAGAPSERAVPERLALLAATRWLAAISTHPVTTHLLKSGLCDLLKECFTMRTDQEVLLQCCVLTANVAADGGSQAQALCEARLPRLISRLLVASCAAELKEHAVAALNRVANAACDEDLGQAETIGPLALAKLATSDRKPCAAEGIWALHILATKGGDGIARQLARLKPVTDVLSAVCIARELEDADLALAGRVAAITLDDLNKLKAADEPPAPKAAGDEPPAPPPAP